MGKKKKEKKSGKSEKPEKKKKSLAAAPREVSQIGDTEALAIFRALSDENRLLILRLLSEKELCTAQLLDAVDVVQSTMSHHMKVLCESGLVTCRRDGKKSCYSLSHETVKRMEEYLEHWE